jgi:SAM-dependent methyltransferase
MRNADQWKPTKYASRPDGSLIVPADSRELGAGSLLIASLVGNWYRATLPRHARGDAIELGCGKMPLYAMYRPHVASITCSDWPGSLHQQQFMDFAADLNLPLPLRDAVFDTIIASDVLEHLYQPQQMLREAFRILRPGGTAIINTPFMYWVHEAPHDYYRYTPFAIRRMAEDAGFEVLELKSIGGAGLVIVDILGKKLRRLPVLGRSMAALLQKFARLISTDIPESAVYPLAVAAVLLKR